MLLSHFTERILAPDRFTDVSLEQTMQMWDQSKSIRENVRRVAEKKNVSELRTWLASLQMIEKENSRVLCVSSLLTNVDWRIVVRPLGLSVITRGTPAQ